MKEGAEEADIALVEIGGTAGDIESLPFMEAIRQMSLSWVEKMLFYSSNASSLYQGGW